MKRIGMAVVTAAVLAMAASAVTAAEANEKVEFSGFSFEIPEELKDLVIVKTSDLPDDVLVEVYEKGSVEAAEALGEDRDGAGWIFSISRVPEAEAKELRCYGMDGTEIFARGEDSCLLYQHPTDVTFVRESVEKMKDDQEVWTMVNSWAYENVRDEILAGSPAYEQEVYTNTDLDMHFARAAYGSDAEYVLRTLDINHGEDLDPRAAEDPSYIEKLAEDFVYEYAPEEAEAEADGEYYVMEFPGEHLRIDFLKSNENLVRETITTDSGEELVSLYAANPKNADNDGETVTSVVAAWCEALAGGEEAAG